MMGRCRNREESRKPMHNVHIFKGTCIGGRPETDVLIGGGATVLLEPFQKYFDPLLPYKKKRCRS